MADPILRQLLAPFRGVLSDQERRQARSRTDDGDVFPRRRRDTRPAPEEAMLKPYLGGAQVGDWDEVAARNGMAW